VDGPPGSLALLPAGLLPGGLGIHPGQPQLLIAGSYPGAALLPEVLDHGRHHLRGDSPDHDAAASPGDTEESPAECPGQRPGDLGSDVDRVQL
jgi:hypothetical protein